MTVIPRIIHQTWRTADVPAEYGPLVQSWRRHNPGWEWRLWTDADNEALLSRVEPELQAVVAACPYKILTIDIVRWVYLREFGGVYVDLDTECLAPLDAAFATSPLILVEEPRVHARRHGVERLVSNAFMGCVAGHPLTRSVLAALTPESVASCSTHFDVLGRTGPIFVTDMFNRFGPTDGELWPASRISPGEQGGPLLATLARSIGEETAERLDLRAAGALAVHYWRNSWTTSLAGELVPFDPQGIDGFDFFPGWDSAGHDLYNAGRDMVEVARTCRANPGVVAFNTDGFVKRWIHPRYRWRRRSPWEMNQGLFVRRGWTSFQAVRSRLAERLFNRSRDSH